MCKEVEQQKTRTLRQPEIKRDEDDNHPRGGEHSHDKRAAMPLSVTKTQAPLEKNVLPEWIRSEEVTMDYREEKLDR